MATENLRLSISALIIQNRVSEFPRPMKFDSIRRIGWLSLKLAVLGHFISLLADPRKATGSSVRARRTTAIIVQLT
jgi:hypothetical protein